jgi:hypothetical protein
MQNGFNAMGGYTPNMYYQQQQPQNPFPYGMPPHGGWYSRGRPRGGRGGARKGNTSVTNLVKSQLGNATGGQLLELTRWIAKRLSVKDASLYGQFLAGLGQNSSNPSTDGADAASSSATNKALRLMLQQHTNDWRKECDNDSLVIAREGLMERIRNAHGKNVAVATILAEEGNDKDIAAYHKGKARAEMLLTKHGLKRGEGDQLELMDPDGTSASSVTSISSATSSQMQRMEAQIFALTATLAQMGQPIVHMHGYQNPTYMARGAPAPRGRIREDTPGNRNPEDLGDREVTSVQRQINEAGSVDESEERPP